MYEAMARRYRPGTFDDVIGQEHVARTLRNAINSDRVAHAYLFCGPHGCGKTSMARIFARALACENGPTAHPCGKCDFCLDIMRGQDVDVQEIDGASNNGVEQVRILREQAAYVPNRARYKIYIIDEVHMLSIAAFNALLKTLEEPPPHVKFILATTDPHKMPDTVLSRCQRFDFRLVPPPILAKFFKGLAEKENAAITAEALEAVAAFSGGSVRDGLVLLDQLLSYAQGEVTREDVEGVRGVAGAETVAGLYEATVAHDVVKALELVDAVAQRGTNVGDFLDQLIEFGRDLMLIIATRKDEGVSSYGPAREALDRLAKTVTLDHVLLILDVFSQARTRVRSRALTNPLVPLEMAVARLAGLDHLVSVKALTEKLDLLARGAPLPAAGISAPVATPTVSIPVAPPVRVAETQPAPPTTATPAVPSPVSEEPASPAPAPTEATEVYEEVSDEEMQPVSIPENPVADTKEAQERWKTVLAVLKERKSRDLHYLHEVYVEQLAGDVLTLSVPGGGSFIFEQLEDTRRKARLAETAAEVMRVPLTLNLKIREDESNEDEEDFAPVGGSALRLTPDARAKQNAREDPVVRMVEDSFAGQVINVETE
jgi:DNA polymerase-3 subunit gamma/tau